MDEKQAREQLQRDKELLAKRKEEQAAAAKGKPTPTQEENDLSKLGVHLEEHEDDGSGGEVKYELVRRQAEAQKPAGAYQTRQATAQRSGERSERSST